MRSCCRKRRRTMGNETTTETRGRFCMVPNSAHGLDREGRLLGAAPRWCVRGAGSLAERHKLTTVAVRGLPRTRGRYVRPPVWRSVVILVVALAMGARSDNSQRPLVAQPSSPTPSPTLSSATCTVTTGVLPTVGARWLHLTDPADAVRARRQWRYLGN
jgi:hypothetical protein